MSSLSLKVKRAPLLGLVFATILANSLWATPRLISTILSEREDVNVFRGFETYGFEIKAPKAHPRAQKGLSNILEGKGIPFPLPLWVASRVIGVVQHLKPQTVQARWMAEGTIPNPFYTPIQKRRLFRIGPRPAPEWFTVAPAKDGKPKWERMKSGSLLIGLGDAVHPQKNRLGIPIKMVTKTCFQCHTSVVPGAGKVAPKIVAGLGANHFDAVTSIHALNLYRGIAQHPAFKDLLGPIRDILSELNPLGKTPTLSARKIQDFKIYSGEVFAPPLSHSRVRGDHMGPFLVWWGAAKAKDPKRSGATLRAIGEKTEVEHLLKEVGRLSPVDPLPWWNMKFKKRAYWFWDAPGHAYTDFNLNFYTVKKGVDIEDSAGHSDRRQHRRDFEAKAGVVKDILSYARQTHSPRFPKAQQLNKQHAISIKRGERVFGKRCAACHGTYKRKGPGQYVVNYPNKGLIDLGTKQRTDERYYTILQKFAPIARRLDLMADFYSKGLAPHSYPVEVKGYIAPVLVGLWASAPYLHNGSVPTLEALLDSSKRPKIWARKLFGKNRNPIAYNWEEFGLAYHSLTSEEFASAKTAAKGKHPESAESINFRRIYNTELLAEGRSNKGHTFGDKLTEPQRKDVIRYLLDISGEAVETAS